MSYGYDESGLDYVGDDDDVGLDYVGDDDDESGARRPRRLRKGKNVAKFAMAGKLPQIFLGFDQTVAASTSGTATAEPNVHLRPTDLIVRASNVEDWHISSIQVGRVAMIAGANNIPASIFGPNQRRPTVSSPKLQAGTNAQIGLVNLTGASSRFLAALVCLDVSSNAASP